MPDGKPETRRVGRPRKMWLQGVEEDGREIKVSRERQKAQDIKERWKSAYERLGGPIPTRNIFLVIVFLIYF